MTAKRPEDWIITFTQTFNVSLVEMQEYYDDEDLVEFEEDEVLDYCRSMETPDADKGDWEVV